jgi:hypothetical protein
MNSLSNSYFGSVFEILTFLLPFIVVVICLSYFWKLWVEYVRLKFVTSQKYVLLKIVPPKDHLKTPAAMELFLVSLYQPGGESTWIDRFWLGKVRAWFSLELVSNGGLIEFYIWTREALSRYIQSQLYAQYPGIEVTELDMGEDYTERAYYPSKDYKMFAAEFGLKKEDPLPIKTYIDFGTDRAGDKEESKIDPITSTLEFLGSLRKDEHFWFQIIVRAHKDEDPDPKKWFGTTDNWKDDAKRLIGEIKESAKDKPKDGKEAFNFPNMTKGQQEKIHAIERSVSKYGFDIGIRTIYIAKKDAFTPTNIGGLTGILKQYASLDLNSFRPLRITNTDYPWEDVFGTRMERLKQEMYSLYKQREYFFTRGKKLVLKHPLKKCVLNTEELATIYHFPGSVAGTPGIGRVDSKKGEAPDNLPIG